MRFPGVGSLIYLAVGVIPDIQPGQTFAAATQTANGILNPRGKLRHYTANNSLTATFITDPPASIPPLQKLVTVDNT